MTQTKKDFNSLSKRILDICRPHGSETTHMALMLAVSATLKQDGLERGDSWRIAYIGTLAYLRDCSGVATEGVQVFNWQIKNITDEKVRNVIALKLIQELLDSMPRNRHIRPQARAAYPRPLHGPALRSKRQP